MDYFQQIVEEADKDNMADQSLGVWVDRFRVVSAGYYAGCGFGGGYA